MSLRGSHLLWAALITAAAIWAFLQFGSGEAAKIRRQLTALAELVEKGKGESQIAGAAKVRKIGALLTPEFEIAIRPYSQVVSDRGELLRVAMGYRGRSETVGVSFRDQELEIDSPRSARLRAIAVVSGDGMRRESYSVAVDWEKLDGSWLIRRFEVLEILEGNPIF